MADASDTDTRQHERWFLRVRRAMGIPDVMSDAVALDLMVDAIVEKHFPDAAPPADVNNLRIVVETIPHTACEHEFGRELGRVLRNTDRGVDHLAQQVLERAGDTSSWDAAATRITSGRTQSLPIVRDIVLALVESVQLHPFEDGDAYWSAPVPWSPNPPLRLGVS